MQTKEGAIIVWLFSSASKHAFRKLGLNYAAASPPIHEKCEDVESRVRGYRHLEQN